MKNKFLLAILFLSFTSTAYTAFSPLDQSIIEIRDIISSRELRRFIPPYESILDIRRVQNGYMITTNHFQLFVEVLYRIQAAPGAKEEAETKSYTLRFNEPTKTK